jgi:hypothetical protein
MARKNTASAPVEAKVEEAQDRPPCLCSCGGTPKGANAKFLPGHDARYHAALKREQARIAADLEEVGRQAEAKAAS